MGRAWRRAAVAALAGAAAIAAQFTAIGPAQAAGPAITIAGSAKVTPVRGYILVAYLDGVYSIAHIHGTISGAKAGEVAYLYGQQFPYKKPAARLGSVTLKNASASYSFAVTPGLATRYAVRLFRSRTSRAMLATSRALNVYVAPFASITGGQQCSRPVCHETFREYVLVPASALRAAMRDHLYPYFGLNLSPTSAPPRPKWLHLDGGSARVGAAHSTASGEFERTITFTFAIGNEGYNWDWRTCLREIEPQNGIGLPGYHGCGATRAPSTSGYLS